MRNYTAKYKQSKPVLSTPCIIGKCFGGGEKECEKNYETHDFMIYILL